MCPLLLLLPIQPQLPVLAVPVDQEAKGDGQSAGEGDPEFRSAQVEEPEEGRDQEAREHAGPGTVVDREGEE